MTELDKLLQELAAHGARGVPHDTESAVWREIRHRRSAVKQTLLDHIAGCIWHWQCAGTACLAALFLGGGFAVLRHETTHGRTFAKVFDMEVFSEHSSTLRLNSLHDQL